MNRLIMAMLAVCLNVPAFAQLQPDQKLVDFQSLVALVNKQYAPYDWKVNQLGFDMLKIGPWLDQVRATKDDISFYEVWRRLHRPS